MSKVNSKYIKFGTGTNEVNSRELPANYTASNYTPAQVGSEGTDKVSSHLKGIDAQFASIPSPSSGDIAETSFSAANNQASAANVTGLAFANGTVRSFRALVSVAIDATADLFEQFTIEGIQKASSWEIAITKVGDSSGVDFTITSAGQIQYTSTNVAGFSSNTIKFRAETTSV